MARQKAARNDKVKEDKVPEKPGDSKEDKAVHKPVSAQPEINIGMVGHVDHGKTTLTEALTGKWTDTHSEEIKRGITIRLGYADSVFYRCGKCPLPDAYTTSEFCPLCSSKTLPVRKVSFVDAPGHESLMATMLSGANIMDGALLLVAANELCPQPQTREHLTALQIMGVRNIVIVQNKIDLVSREQALKNYEEIREFVKGTQFENSPIIPISAQQRVNIDVLISAIQEAVPTPERDSGKPPLMYVARSFDINRPGTNPLEMVGGVIGGAVKQGVLKVNDTIEIRPGRRIERAGKVFWQPIITTIVGLKTGGAGVESVGPGGSVGVMTFLDPSLVKSDALTGSVIGTSGLPPVWHELKLEVFLLERVVGAKDKLVVEPIKLGESLMLNVNSAATVGIVTELQKNMALCKLKLPVCAEPGSRATISRLIGTRWRLIGYGMIK
ncbi:translation initiation factor IF-2 subunit gamma [Candidatus Woesearchaeota archaeon]|nr:translation initiation factor IF-2 subunit gamma [Candidatus Woesearchaeota archaeon]